MTELAEQAGLPRPEIEEGAGSLIVRFLPDGYIAPRQVKQDLTERQRDILAILADAKSGLALREVRAKLEVGGEEWEIKNDLATLKSLKLVRSTGRGRGARWVIG